MHEPEPPPPLLVRDWLAARSIARGLPAPVEDRGGWRVETGLPTETRRYVFASVSEGLQGAAQTISSPLIFLKLCGSSAAMRAVVPVRWQVHEGGHFMTFEGGASAAARPPAGYVIEMSESGDAITARILTRDGALAASGFAARANGVFIYDRIATQAAHRRRGLGSAILGALASKRRPADTRQALVATEEGRLLYARLGWVVRSPWTTAVIDSA